MTELETFEVILEHPVLYMYVYMETGEVLFRYGSNPKSYLLLLPLAPALPSSFPHCVFRHQCRPHLQFGLASPYLLDMEQIKSTKKYDNNCYSLLFLFASNFNLMILICDQLRQLFSAGHQKRHIQVYTVLDRQIDRQIDLFCYIYRLQWCHVIKKLQLTILYIIGS